MDNYAPKYVLIQNYIIDKINQGNLAIGDKLPSENELSQIFNVSRVTSNKAIAELNIMGIVERIRGKGTFVKTSNLRFQDMTHVLSETFKISSEISELKAHKVVKMEFMKANEGVVEKLHLKHGEEVFKIVRVMNNYEEPIGIDYTYIPASMFNGNIPDETKFSNYYVHEYIKMFLGKKPKYLHIHIDAKLPSNFEMKVLNAPEDKPLIIWDSNIIDEDNKIIAYTTTIAKADKYKPFINFELK